MVSLEVTALRKEFPVLGGIEVAVDDISFSVEDNEFLTLVGPSGCGKTTTLRCIAGLEDPTSGRISYRGEDLTDVPCNERNLAMMFQNIALYPHMTVMQNIAYPLKVRGVPVEEREEEARAAAEIMQVAELLDKYPGDVSGGQRQRVALARTITQDPIAFLMDEPLSDLDAKLKIQIRKEVQRLQKRVGKPTIYVTHDQEEAMTMSDRIAVMNEGRIEQIDTPDALYEAPANLFVASFIGTPTINRVPGRLLDATDPTVTVALAETSIELQGGYRAPEVVETNGERDVVIGCRPENLALDADPEAGDLRAEIQLLERTGDKRLATLQYHDDELQATLPARTDFTEGDRVAVSLSRDDVFVFDAESGTLLASG